MTPSSSNIQRPIGLLKRILYRDNGVLVLNKPPGLACQKNINSHERDSTKSEFNQVLADLREHLSLKDLPYPVHRLDKGTTGALLVACTAPHARELSRQFQARTVEKTYLALVRGNKQVFVSNVGEIRDPIQYIDGRASLDQHGSKPSVTKWELVASSTLAPISLLRLSLLTGHKHQLRVHLAQSLNTPILGDDLYSTLPTVIGINNDPVIPKNRLFLHATDLAFFRYRSSGPNKRTRVMVRAPLPKDFVRICTDMSIPIGIEYVAGGVYINGERESKRVSIN